MRLRFVLPVDSMHQQPDLELHQIMEYNLALWCPRADDVLNKGPWRNQTFVDALWVNSDDVLTCAWSNRRDDPDCERLKLFVWIVAAGMRDFFERLSGRGWSTSSETIGARLRYHAVRWPDSTYEW